MTAPRVSGRNNGDRRPTLLVADDNASILKTVSTLLEKDFDLVAAVPDGRQALDETLRLDPDVAVLDVTMPHLNGFQTARELKRAGSRAKIVLLTLHDADEYVGAAIEAGAEGYVIKTRMLSDLASAIEHAMAGRLFVPSLTSLLAATPAGVGRHAVQFRSNDRAAFDELSQLLGVALRRGDMAAIVATDAFRACVTERLFANGYDIAEAARRGRFIQQDASAELSKVIVNGQLDASRIAASIDDFERARLALSASYVTIVGDMSVVLCRDGNSEAAIQLERAWDDLTRGLPILTVCSYPIECFGQEGEPFSSICAAHSAVCHALDA